MESDSELPPVPTPRSASPPTRWERFKTGVIQQRLLILNVVADLAQGTVMVLNAEAAPSKWMGAALVGCRIFVRVLGRSRDEQR